HADRAGARAVPARHQRRPAPRRQPAPLLHHRGQGDALDTGRPRPAQGRRQARRRPAGSDPDRFDRRRAGGGRARGARGAAGPGRALAAAARHRRAALLRRPGIRRDREPAGTVRAHRLPPLAAGAGVPPRAAGLSAMDRGERALWAQADAALDLLLDLPPDARQARLQALALAPEVAARVRRLLAASDADGPLDRPPGRAVPEAATAPSLAGRQLGRWRLEQWLGEGGMAVVYRASSTSPPVGQQAAVKILSLGALARGGRERFLREQAVLARLRHPYIAALYEAGVDDDGTPWLAMVLVEGQRIDQWCQSRRLGLEARLDLVAQVAEALAYAHRHLVVHRDIKPSNVLVDEDGLVRLLDFGIGRELASDATRTRSCVLTPEYASPEQFAGHDSGTATDVYGLAALCYRLLAGSAPNPGAAAHARPPERPSACAARAPAGSPERGFAPRLRGDLDAVVLRGLDPDPAQRYPGVDAFVADLDNYRRRRPVRARTHSTGYRLRRFAQR